jgi:hypothetical protein
MSPTETAILPLLARLPFLRAHDLCLELRLGKTQVYEALARLQQRNFLEKIGASFCLSAQGASFVCAHDPSMASGGFMQEHILLRLLPRLSRLHFLHQMVASLVRGAPTRLGKQGKKASIEWSWIRDYQESLPATQGYPQPARLFADGLVVLRVRRLSGLSLLPLFLLLDHECLPQAQIRQRLKTLLHARAVARAADPACFPLVVVLLSAPQRMRHWQRWTAQLCARETMPLRGCLSVAPSGADFWRLPWQTLTPYGPAQPLREILQPYPANAVPLRWLAPSHHGADLGAHRDGCGPGLSANWHKPHYVQRLSGSRVGLLALSLEDLHYRLLELLLQHPLLTRAQMAALFSIQEETISRALSRLSQHRGVESEAIGHDPVICWRLGSVGLRLLALRHHLSIRGLTASVSRQLIQLRRQAERTLALSAFFARLAASPAQPADRLLWWETGYAPEQSYYSHARSVSYSLQTDALAEYQAGAKRLRFWVEYAPQVACLKRYAAFVRSGEWRSVGQVLPLLLLICSDGRAERLIWQQKPATGGDRLVIFSTTVELLHAHGPRACIWLADPISPRRRFDESSGKEEYS